jgi:dihydrodiol dehydrogenase / D-xylose 1-dehydrogenase (NADP)
MTFRWGLIGHGHISLQFLEAIGAVEGAAAVAVAGRDAARVGAYASEHGLTPASSVAELVAGDIDAVYVCAPHTAHLAAAVECVNAGVAVLVEKPMTPTAVDTRRLIAAAEAANTFAMEAVWTRFLPIYDVVRGWIADGRIGEIQLVSASFGFAASPNPDHRLFSPSLAGGSILDIGIYPLTLAEMITGAPADELRAVGHVGSTGVDEHVAVAGRYGSVVAQLSSAVRANLDHTAVILGSEGSIEIPVFWGASETTLVRGDNRETISRPHPANGFEYEIEHVMECVGAGLTESAVMPLSVSLRMAEQCDELRRQVGVRYPFESATT